MPLTHLHRPHAFELTPRQVEVLRLLEAGRTNPEIAAELGVSLDGAKYHVREIIGKLGVSSREEAVLAWRGQSQRTFLRRFGWLATSPAALRVAALAAILVVAAGATAAVITWAVNRGDDAGPAAVDPSPSPSATGTASPSPSASPTASPTAPPEVIAGIEVRPLVRTDPIPLPNDLALYIEKGCWGCDVPAESLQRVYRAPDGTVRTEDLYVGADPAGPEPGFIMSINAETAFDILISICDGPTYCGGVPAAQEGSFSSVRHSTDGGITWTSEPQVPGGMYVSANLGGGSRGGFGVVYRYLPDPDAPNVLYFYPSLETAPTAASAIVLDPSYGPPLVVGDDGVSLYRVDAGTTGEPWFRFGQLPPNSVIQDFQWLTNGFAVTWRSGTRLYTGFGASQPGQDATLTEVSRWPEDSSPFFHRPQGGFVGERLMVVAVNAGNVGLVPAVIDFEAATIRPIAEFGDAQGERNMVKAVQVGPFARVTGTDGDCLNIREAPSTTAKITACYPDGVLLVPLGERSTADGMQWALVDTPARIRGWASTEFLESSGEAPSVAGHPPGTRTGIPEVDAVIAALAESSTVPDSLVQWRKVACGPPPIEGRGPPECPEGVASGTPIDVISGAACEGYWRIRPADGSGVRLSVAPQDRLYAVARAEAPWSSEETVYEIIYVLEDPAGWGKIVHVGERGVVGDSTGCATTAAEMLDRYSGVILGPPPP
jgi:DNA-binding CsgD family transcriptional regulator